MMPITYSGPCVAGFQAHGPRHESVGDHLLDERIQFIPRGRDTVTERLEVGRAVPDDGLDVGFDGEAQPSAVNHTGVNRAGDVRILAGSELIHFEQFVLVLGQLRDVPEGDVRRSASLHAGIEQCLVAGGFGLEDNAAGFHKRLKDLVEAFLFLPGPLI
jgi:hypothetical protein